jgi:Bifunctional DNA primase/polymerase, N-terminal
MSDILAIALEYIGRGWSPIPVPHKSKRPLGEEWQNLRITRSTAPKWFNGGLQNVGVLLGEASDGLADSDLDCSEAIAAAPYFLPRTLCFGRASKPRSHWLYQSDLWQTEDTAAIQFKFITGKGKDRKEQMILELRIGGGNKGAQTVFPGSVHETGEPITWCDREAIVQADGADLKHRCARTASAALIACHFPSKGARHDAGLTIGGFLYRCGFSRPDTELFAEAVTIASGQPLEKVKDVRKAAREAWDEGSRPGGKARGFPALAETFGDDVAKNVAAWLGYEGIADQVNVPNSAKPNVQLSADLHSDLSNCERLLINSPLVEVYQRAGCIVRRGTAKGKNHAGEVVTFDRVARHNVNSFLSVMAQAITFLSPGKLAEERHPPREYSRLLLDRPEKDYPVLHGLISAPALRADGSVLDKPGYDERTGIFFDNRGVDFGSIPASPTKDDALAALRALIEPIAKFPFVDEASKSVQLARMLTGVCRTALPTSPLFGYTSPAARTGKSMLIDIACVLSHGHAAPVVAASSAIEELDKQLQAMVSSGDTIIALDNQDTDEALESNLLCQMLTQSVVKIRPFGQNQDMLDFPSLAVISTTGNNLAIAKDLTERTILCSLDAKMEIPGSRKFDFSPVAMALKNRAHLVRACLIILKAYVVAGRPPQGITSRIGVTWCGPLWSGSGPPILAKPGIKFAQATRTEASK